MPDPSQPMILAMCFDSEYIFVGRILFSGTVVDKWRRLFPISTWTTTLKTVANMQIIRIVTPSIQICADSVKISISSDRISRYKRTDGNVSHPKPSRVILCMKEMYNPFLASQFLILFQFGVAHICS